MKIRKEVSEERNEACSERNVCFFLANEFCYKKKVVISYIRILMNELVFLLPSKGPR